MRIMKTPVVASYKPFDLLVELENLWNSFGVGGGGNGPSPFNPNSGGAGRSAAPVVTAADDSLTVGTSVAASALIASATDASGAAITEYSFRVSGAGAGSFLLNGETYTAGAWVTVTAADLAQLTYVAGPTAGAVDIQIEAFAGALGSRIATSVVTQTAATAVADTGIAADLSAELGPGRTLTYAGLLKILEDAASGGMSAAKYQSLQTLASWLNGSGANTISTSAYLEFIADDVIDGQGRSSGFGGLGILGAGRSGGLSATSTAAQVDDLIDQWFLGTNEPATNVTRVGGARLASTYQTSSLPLYGASGAPVYTDVNQGNTGDCYFLAAIGEVALQDPNALESMIVSDGGGVYGVRFDVNGQDDWVTVNSSLPTLTAASPWANGSNLEFANGNVLWPALLEKAFAEITPGDSYAAISGGTGAVLSEITGQSVSDISLAFGRRTSSTAQTAALSSDNSTLGAAFSAGQELLVGTSGYVSGADLVADHMFEVTGYNTATQTLTLHNPWGSAASSSQQIDFSISLASLAKDDCVVYYTSGKAIG